MSRHEKQNTIPIAPFDLHTRGATPAAELEKTLGHGFRIAYGASNDTRATIDPTPCPHCGSKVEWAATTRHKERYVYARCRGKYRHMFSEPEGSIVDVTISRPQGFPNPRPSTGMTSWLTSKTAELQEQMRRLEEISKMVNEFRVTTTKSRPPPPVLGEMTPVPSPNGAN